MCLLACVTSNRYLYSVWFIVGEDEGQAALLVNSFSDVFEDFTAVDGLDLISEHRLV